MTTIRSLPFLISLVAASTLCFSACSSKTDDPPDDEPTGSGGSGAGGKDSGGASSGGSGTGGSGGAVDGGEDTGGAYGTGGGASDGGTDGGKGGTGAGGSAAGGGGAGGKGVPATSCSTGALWAGNPEFDGDYRDVKPSGQGLFDDAPLRIRNMAVIGSRFFAETQFEIWSADLSSPPPVISRLAGNEPVTDTARSRIEAGRSCKDTQFIRIAGMAATTDGKLVVTDDIGGAVVELTDPAGPECQSHYVAGTHETFLDSDIPFGAFSANEGDVVGKGADAKFAAVDKVTVDLGGNIYVSDFGNHKLKKIGTDGDRTVTTVATLGASDQVFALAWLGGKLYASGTDGSDDFLLRVDPAKATDNVEELFRERGHFPDVDSSTQAVLTSLVTDGEALIVGGKGYIWRMDKDGEVLATLAGAGAALEFPSDFDPKVPHPAGEWPFVMPGSGDTWLMHAGGRIYWAAGIGVARTVVRFNCP